MVRIMLQKILLPAACLYIQLVENFVLQSSADKLKCLMEKCIGFIDNFFSDILYSINLCNSQKDNDFIQTVLSGFPKNTQTRYL